MYRRSSLFSSICRTKFKEKFISNITKTTDKNVLDSSLLVPTAQQQHFECKCGYRNYGGPVSAHKKQGQERSESRTYNTKSAWMMLSGTGLVSYSVWKARHLIKDARSSFVVYAEGESPPESKQTSGSKQDNDKVIPDYCPYLIIGAGTAAHSAMRAIRLRDHKAQVLMIGEEKNNPYSRPPLSKELWYGEKTGIFYDPTDFYIEAEDLPHTKYGGVSVVQGTKVVKLDTDEQVAYLDNGHQVKYDKCLIATGGHPKNLPVFEEADFIVKSRVHVFRTLDDFVRLHTLVHTDKAVAVIGGGFLGCELACGMAYRGQNRGVGVKNLKVYQIFPEKGVMRKVLPDFLSKYQSEKIKNEGVDVMPGRSIKSVKYEDRQLILTLSDDSQVTVDDVLVTVGIQPNDDLARTSDLEVDPERGGVMANAELEVKPNHWVAGDVASFYDYKYGRCRMEHHNTADSMGKIAGENMAGAKKLFEHEPYFWSDMGSESYQVIGDADSSLETFSIFKRLVPKGEKTDIESEATNPDVLNPKHDHEGVVFYYRDKEIVGILLWNVFGRGKVHTAKQILKKSKELKNEDPFELSKLLFRRYKRPKKNSKKKDVKP